MGTWMTREEADAAHAAIEELRYAEDEYEAATCARASYEKMWQQVAAAHAETMRRNGEREEMARIEYESARSVVAALTGDGTIQEVWRGIGPPSTPDAYSSPPYVWLGADAEGGR